MKTATVTASNHQQIRSVTMHPFVTGAKRYTDDQLDSDGRRALLKIRVFNSRVAATRRNMAEEVEAYGGSDAQPRQNQHKVRLDLLRVAYADSKVPTDLARLWVRFFQRSILWLKVDQRREPHLCGSLRGCRWHCPTSWRLLREVSNPQPKANLPTEDEYTTPSGFTPCT